MENPEKSCVGEDGYRPGSSNEIRFFSGLCKIRAFLQIQTNFYFAYLTELLK